MCSPPSALRKGSLSHPTSGKILFEAASVGNATTRAIAYRSRLKEAFLYPDSAWVTPFVGGSYQFLHDGVRLLDAWTYFFFYGTGITPAMALKTPGQVHRTL